MGCLFEIIFEILIAGALEGMMFVSLKFTSILIPEKEFNENNKQKIKNVIVMITVFEFLSVFQAVALVLKYVLYLVHISVMFAHVFLYSTMFYIYLLKAKNIST